MCSTCCNSLSGGSSRRCAGVALTLVCRSDLRLTTRMWTAHRLGVVPETASEFLIQAVCLALGKNAFLEAPGKPTGINMQDLSSAASSRVMSEKGHSIPDGRHHSRRRQADDPKIDQTPHEPLLCCQPWTLSRLTWRLFELGAGALLFPAEACQLCNAMSSCGVKGRIIRALKHLASPSIIAHWMRFKNQQGDCTV